MQSESVDKCSLVHVNDDVSFSGLLEFSAQVGSGSRLASFQQMNDRTVPMPFSSAMFVCIFIQKICRDIFFLF